MPSNISVCLVIFEMTNPTSEIDFSEGASSKDITTDITQGRREAREYTVKTFYNKAVPSSKQPSFFPKSRLTSESSSRQESVEPDLVEPFCEAADDKDVAGDMDSVTFISGNPYVETTRGILHLYKEDSLSTLEAGSSRCDSVCILAVPATMTCNDLLSFTAPCHDDIKHLRIIRDGTPNQYMALLTFRTQHMAREFYSSFNGIPFNSLEPECVCQLVFVSGITVEDSTPQPPALHTELPTCPVCLERMDESVDGILTILCNHSFHSNCLAKWGDMSCPVCRYFQTPELVADNRCLQCLSDENLWICLICGHVGCGRYVEGHAYKHYVATQHCYSMQLGSNRVWDYAGDNFVHRLLQNKGDGKLVEGEHPSKDPGIDEKMDSMQLEWTYNLTSQLEKQKEYFEEKLGRLQLSLSSESAELRQKLVKTVEDNRMLQSQLAAVTTEKMNLEKKVASLKTRLATTLTQLQEEREMGKALQRNQGEWQTKFNKLEQEFKTSRQQKDQEISEMKDQLRDIMFYMEAQNKIASSELRDEAVEGHIVVPEPPTAARGRRKRR